MHSRLNAYCARAFPAKQGVCITNVACISAGWKSDIYSFTVESGSASARKCVKLT